ncbi:MAG: homoserine dehydrogenase [Clostridiales bacterium]|nr:homoserine dehydrogenase [Clostridiales bacterium]
MVYIAVMGHGVVGSGVVEVLQQNHAGITSRSKEDIRVKYILDLREFPDLPYADRFTKDFEVIVGDPEVKVVVETMGGLHPAYEYVKRCLRAGKSVATSNKELVACKGAELLRIARDNNVNFLFEASVGGGIPILRPISQCLAANDIFEIVGILNGTTNFILTKMIREQMSFADALTLAQELGYAERDPSADIEGQDACRKICILASLAFGKHVYPEQVGTDGITKITLTDVEYAGSDNCVIKLIGRAKILDGGHIFSAVYPALVSRESQLSSVDDVFNAVMVRGNAIGDVIFYGRGAGKLPTASAVVADVIDCVKHLSARKYLFWEDGKEGYVSDPLEDNTRLYVRAKTEDKTAAAEEIRRTFEDARILSRPCEDRQELAFITPMSTERTLRRELAALTSLRVESILHVLD